MSWVHNPYQASLDALDQAMTACERAMMAAEELPPAEGRGEVWDAADGARHRLYEARVSIETWHEAYRYHLSRADL
jgi:hypothetical protein